MIAASPPPQRPLIAPVSDDHLPEPHAAVTEAADETEMPLPFDAVLGTILYSPDRKLAIVNGRIVGPGDDVNGARIVDITPTAVLLRDAQGRLRNLTLGGRTPPAS